MAHLGKNVGIVGVELDGPLISGERFIVAPLVETGASQCRVAAGIGGVERHRELRLADRLIERWLRRIGPIEPPSIIERARHTRIAAGIWWIVLARLPEQTSGIEG